MDILFNRSEVSPAATTTVAAAMGRTPQKENNAGFSAMRSGDISCSMTLISVLKATTTEDLAGNIFRSGPGPGSRAVQVSDQHAGYQPAVIITHRVRGRYKECMDLVYHLRMGFGSRPALGQQYPQNLDAPAAARRH
ncbi:hypothetical protein ACTXI0_15890 [Arthrobacter rhombi]|uniref:hypothetical protein n=1 Tax=Arthrobacter rhombi TaxID=71253 RepID=UPI003FD2B84F